MFTPDQYELLDFGEGRRLERFGGVMLDRPCPAAEGCRKAAPKLWAAAGARFEQGAWIERRALPERWSIRHAAAVMELKRTEFGHLGIFPEQAANWQWLAEHAAQPPKILNLFAYTGGSTLAAAAALGAEVTHVDAAKNIVAWARRNAELSGLADATIRWIAEDAQKFVHRELKRGNRYDAVILDPPSYGHGLHGESWKLSKDLPGLLDACARLTDGRRRFVLLTCHTPGYGRKELCQMLSDAFGGDAKIDAKPMHIRAATGHDLPSGVAAFWEKR